MGEINDLHRDIDFTKCKIDYRVDSNPVYFRDACLMLGLYSIFLLFILSDYKYHSITDDAWAIFSIGAFIYLVYFLIKEWLVFRSIISSPSPDSENNLQVIIITSLIFASSFIIALLWDYQGGDNSCNTLMTIRYLSIFMPYISFIICFFLHLCSIVYAKWKLFFIKIKIRKQGQRIRQIISKNKVSDVSFG